MPQPFIFKMEKLTGKITAISAGRSRRARRSNIFLDGKFAFSLDNEVIAREKLKVGCALPSDYVRELANIDHFQRCLNAAFDFLSFRPRSETETRQRLQRRGFESVEIERALSELKRLNLIDDAVFAEYWKENRNSFRPRSQRMVKLELRSKGVETAIVDEVVDDIDDSQNAYRAAMEKARKVPVNDYQIFRRKLGGYLQRRGFGYGVINKVIDRVWAEKINEER
jgi:regulatory protein